MHARDETRYTDAPQKIEKTFGRMAPSYYLLTTEFSSIKLTAEHPVWKQGSGWTQAQYLEAGDVVASAEGDVLILRNRKVEKPIRVYNFSVANTPNYFVGAGRIWVHNASSNPCNLDDIPKGTKPLAKNDKGEWYDPATGEKVDIVDMPEDQFGNFTNGTARPLKLEPGTTIYRVYGNKAAIDGPYWTLERPTDKASWREDYAVLDEWGNDGSKIVKYTVKEGDNIGGWVGEAASQTSMTGEVLDGGKRQVFIDMRGKDLVDVPLPSGWE